MLAIEAGDHIGVPFAANASFAITTASFAHQALDAGGQVIVFPGELTGESAEQLSSGNLRLREASRCGQLSFADCTAVQLATGRFDPAHLHQIYVAASVRALDAGYTGLWVSIDMSWAGPGAVACRALTTYEAQAFPLFRKRTLTAICHYDTRVFSPEAVREVCAAHPASLRGSAMRYRFQDRTVLISGDTDLTNRLAFETIVCSLADGDTLDLTGMRFFDMSAAATVARAAFSHPRLRIVAGGSCLRDLLVVAGVPRARIAGSGPDVAEGHRAEDPAAPTIRPDHAV